MHHPAFRDTSKLAKENWGGEPARAEWPLYLRYMQLQLTELLTGYGPVALIWFDGLHHQEKYGGIRCLDLIHRLQPSTLVNDRIGLPGDYQTPKQFIPSGIPTRGVRFNAADTSVQDRLKNTVPKPEDFQLWETCMTINNTWAYNSHDHEYKSLSVIGESIYGTTYGPVQGVSSIRTTAKKDKVFVHVFDWPRGPLEINGFKDERFQLIWLLAVNR
jgi:alpha-L-fucosidase